MAINYYPISIILQFIDNGFIMNIMQFLGFSKKGDAKPSEPVRVLPSRPKELINFSDKCPRVESETRIYNLIILDESGSMGQIRRQALSGANETIQSIRTAQQENPDDHQMLSFVTFDQASDRPDVRVLIDNEKIEDVKDLTIDQYIPNGMTPLYDAMGKAITSLEKLVIDGDHVLVTVITDGLENASRFYTAEQIKELVDSLSSKGWVFTYIGANQDSERTASGLGIRSSMDFEASEAGACLMYDKMRSSHRSYYKKVRQSKLTGEQFDLADDFFSERESASRVTPDLVETLQDGQIFVFGSNTAGHHNGGASWTALQRFGAVEGQGEGLQGQSYAIPTDGSSILEIRRSVARFIAFADSHPELTFLVTRIGCGTAGFRDEEIAPFFAHAYSLSNVYLPASFWKVLSYRFNA